MKGPKLFSGYEFYFTGEHQSRPSKQDLEQLIHISGGIVLAKDPRSCLSHKSTPPYHTCTGSQNVVLVMGNSQMDSENCSTECILQVYPSWIFDCLSEFRLLL